MSLEQSNAVGGEIVHLSRRQKRDLLELAAAGVMSTIFFAAPVLLIRDAPPAPVTSPQVGLIASAPAAVRVQIATTDVTAPVSTPALQPVRRRESSSMRRGTVAGSPARVLASTAERAPLGRRIARLFAGDGTHAVHPFPMIPTARR